MHPAYLGFIAGTLRFGYPMALWPRAEWITRPQDKSSRVEKLDTGRNVADPVLVAEYHKVGSARKGQDSNYRSSNKHHCILPLSGPGPSFLLIEYSTF
ncbi:uncharacterized protein H6S33_004595 [Morchella sextelata]|uniref:uncharacterized protein n=1 Tax=Morchella sextelata TaxID=1174677 RepID=UPI001D03D879|nr:uncharacterized protein H6S33_004595 [Morchella sextelata]KAH0605373.1 hypothetical protein H6S33_004595 [Morchella sextelata]